MTILIHNTFDVFFNFQNLQFLKKYSDLFKTPKQFGSIRIEMWNTFECKFASEIARNLVFILFIHDDRGQGIYLHFKIVLIQIEPRIRKCRPLLLSRCYSTQCLQPAVKASWVNWSCQLHFYWSWCLSVRLFLSLLNLIHYNTISIRSIHCCCAWIAPIIVVNVRARFMRSIELK